MFIVVAIIFSMAVAIFYVSFGNVWYCISEESPHLPLQLRKYQKWVFISGFTALTSLGTMIAMYFGVIGGWFS